MAFRVAGGKDSDAPKTIIILRVHLKILYPEFFIKSFSYAIKVTGAWLKYGENMACNIRSY